MTESIIEVVICEDHAPLREALSLLIGGTPGYQVVASYPDAISLLADLPLAGEVLLMDISMPGLDGVEAVKRLRQQQLGLRIMMLTVFDDEAHLFQAICAGASGYLLKSSPPAALLQAIREVHAGGAPLSPAIARRTLSLLQRFGGQADASAYDLTPRETQVLTELVKGLSTKMIAARLEISYETVRSHLKMIYDKLHVASMTEAVAKALRERLVD
jgi:DNA-binding NarL/FixJ family response regulator